MIDTGQSLLEKMEYHIAANLDNEQFGVQQLADMMSMSRSYLHRKLKQINGKSISSTIRDYRLKVARKMLEEKQMTAAEVSHQVGFGSSSYFNKCFTKYYGYSPGKARLKNNRLILESTVEHHLKTRKSVMVLPFKNLSPNTHNQYLADGMVDAIGRHLSEINGLKVISSSVFHERNSLEALGRDFGVATVIKGSLQKQDAMIRIEVKLLDTSDGKLIWARHYDRELLNVLQIQSDISKKVARALETNISAQEHATIKKRTSYHPKAYDHYLKGMYYLNQIGNSGMDKALVYFEKAIVIDSLLAPAYSAIAVFYQMKASIFSATIDSMEAFKKAQHYLDIAMSLDKTWHFNFTTKAFQLTFFHWNFEEADRYYKMGLKNKKPLNRIMYRDFLQLENRHGEALEIALSIDRETPFYPNLPLIMSYYYNGLYEDGEAYIKERLPMFPKLYFSYDSSGFFYLNTGNYDRAIELFQKVIQLEGKRFPRILGWMGAAYARMGKIGKARELISELKKLKKKTDAGSPAWFTGIIHSALGEKYQALKYLTTAIQDHELEVVWLVSEPQLYALHGIPEFDALVKRIGFRKTAYPVKLSSTVQ